MIYTKKANFPYPVLMNFTDDYNEPEFELDVNIFDNTDDYKIKIDWKISSSFIGNLLQLGKADLIFIVKSRDNQFYRLKNLRCASIDIPKTKLSINTRTVMQLGIFCHFPYPLFQNNS